MAIDLKQYKDIPHGDMPGDKVEIGEEHVKKALVIMDSLMDQLRKEGKSIIMISEEIMELIGMCDRVVILKDGEISGEFARIQDLTEQDLIKAMV